MQQSYDYIIAGAGAAGLSLAWKLLHSPLADKEVLIIDQDLTPRNNKTWCFWDSGAPPFADIIHKKWEQIEISTSDTPFTQRLHQYPYYCIRSIDFQQKVLEAIEEHPHFKLMESDISGLNGNKNSASIHADNTTFNAKYIFQSCFSPWNNTGDRPHYPLLQHFLGWEVELNEPLFSQNTFTLMDFDETFTDGIAFIYMLPWSQQTGLIEYTIFSDTVLPKEFYEEKISLYLNNRYGLKPINYKVKRREFGKIPMMDRPVKHWYQPRILNLGTVAGVTKPSTGYTFHRIQKQTQHIVDDLLAYGAPKPQTISAHRFKAYDLWLLQIIDDHPQEALEVFYYLFENNSADNVFRFLAEETSLLQDLKIMSSVPYFPFLRAIWKTCSRLRKI